LHHRDAAVEEIVTPVLVIVDRGVRPIYGREFVVVVVVDVVVLVVVDVVVLVIVIMIGVVPVRVRGELAVHAHVHVRHHLEADHPEQRGPQRERSAADVVGSSLALGRHPLWIHIMGRRAGVLGTSPRERGIAFRSDLACAIEAYGR
jgi:hypothetical protein